MKLLEIFSSTRRGEAEDYTLTVATTAVHRGWQVHAAFPQTAGTRSLVQDFKANQIQYHVLPISEVPTGGHKLQAKRLVRLIGNLVRTVILLLQVKPDVVLLNLPWADCCFASLVACGMLRIPTLVVLHMVPYQFQFHPRRVKAYAWARARQQQWVTISNYQRKFVSESFKLPLNQVGCVYPGIKLYSAAADRTMEGTTKLRSQVCQELNLPETSILALTVGPLYDYKGWRDLIPAIPPLVHDFPSLKFIWIGEGSQRQALVEQLKDYGVENYVMFLGDRPDQSRFLRAADLFVFPSHYEGAPYALLDAMTHGLPIVSSDASCIPEIITHQEQGLLFRAGNSYELLERLHWALQHPYQMQEMADNALQRVQFFSEERMLKETFELLEKLTAAVHWRS